MKQFKLKLHNGTNSSESLIFNSSDLPKIKQNDLLKIFQQNNSLNYYLFKVSDLKDQVVQKDCISINQTLANSIGLQSYQNVNVLQVEPEDFTIDLVEVTFKDQYISRSDMWRMKKYLVNSCAYVDQQIDYCDVRAQVSELWVDSMKSRCGFISDSTNFVLRSYTAKVYVFIQMSSEMWEYDAYGYLQFERAIDGLLKALFTKWKDKKCFHELTLVLFSRTFYKTKDLADFPDEVQEAVRTDYRGLFYIDFYKCVVHSEKLEDCTPLLTKLRKLFQKYDKLTEITGCPKGKNSTSAEGNFLEAINMSLNVFERHNIDRNFDGTGQIVVCITPGVGVFDVDRDLTILTKERMIDNGIGSDLICLGQQPLHAVPLFKFHQKRPEGRRASKTKFSKKSTQSVQYDFNIPHWINHSFYTSNPFPDKGTTNIKFIPRIHAPVMKPKKLDRALSSTFSSKPVSTEPDELPNIQQMTFGEHDKQVFVYQKSSMHLKQAIGDGSGFKNASSDNMKKKLKASDGMRPMSPESRRIPSRPMHIPLYKPGFMKPQEGLASSLGVTGNLDKYFKNKRKDEDLEIRPIIGSATMTRSVLDDTSSPVTRRALFNPFNPLQMFAPLTANRRRWVHTYPRGPQGEALVLHHRNPSLSRLRSHQQTSESTDDEASLTFPFGLSNSPAGISKVVASSPASYGFSTQHSIQASFEDSSNSTKGTSVGSCSSNKGVSVGGLGDYLDSSPGEGSYVTFKGVRSAKPISSFGLSWMWGIAGDIQWTPDTYTGLDWKSLKCPACLPITTDYCPQQSHLQSAYTEHAYALVPDDSTYSDEKGDEDPSFKVCFGKNCRSAEEVFLELINQRLCQGFQLIKQTKRLRNTDSSSSCATLTSPTASDGSFRSFATGASPMYTSMSNAEGEWTSTGFKLSHGRQYHILRMLPDDDKIEVKIYRPRHPSATVTLNYNYMLWPMTRGQFQTAWTTFAHVKVEDSFWNHFDDYICYPDDSSLQDLIYWRTKFVTVASPAKRLLMLRTANEKNPGSKRFDVFDGCGCQSPHKYAHEKDECTALIDGFARFLEHLNKFKKNAAASRRSWKPSSNNLAKSYQNTSSGMGATNSNQATPTPPRATSSTPTSEHSTPVRFVLDSSAGAPPPPLSGHLNNRGDIHQPVALKHTEGSSPTPQSKKISINSEMIEIIEAMKDEQSGINFLSEKSGLPKHTFLSFEAVHWAMENVDGIYSIKDACHHFERIRSYGFFTHVSGDGTFSYGYLLYALNENKHHFELEDPTSYQYLAAGCTSLPRNRWFEVVFKRMIMEKEDLCYYHRGLSVSSQEPRSGAFSIPSSKKDLKRKITANPVSKLVKIPLLNSTKAQRSEWFQLKYSSATYCGVDSFVFCFQVEWLIATATYLFNQLQSWSRDAGRCEMYIFPVPCNPFAFPRSGVTGPLRCPLFVFLNLQELLAESLDFQDEVEMPEKYRVMIIAFMDAILRRFGFLRDEYYDDENETDLHRGEPASQNYIHFTGQVLAQIPVRDRSVQRNSISHRQRSSQASAPIPPVTQSELDGTGFYWSYNHMQTKRWRHSALDECPPAELEKDFVAFCSNANSRLIIFFQEFCANSDIL